MAFLVGHITLWLDLPMYGREAVGDHDALGPEEVAGCPEESLGAGPGTDV